MLQNCTRHCTRPEPKCLHRYVCKSPLVSGNRRSHRMLYKCVEATLKRNFPTISSIIRLPFLCKSRLVSRLHVDYLFSKSRLVSWLWWVSCLGEGKEATPQSAVKNNVFDQNRSIIFQHTHQRMCLSLHAFVIFPSHWRPHRVL